MDTAIIDKKITELRQEFDAGKNQCVQLQSNLDELQKVLLRISGAIQALEELKEEQAKGQ